MTTETEQTPEASAYDPFAELDAILAPVLAKAEAERRKKELEKTFKGTKSDAVRMKVRKELSEIHVELEAAKWQPIALLLISQHRVCKSCGLEHTIPDGIFVQRQTAAKPHVLSRKRVDKVIADTTYYDLPKACVLISQTVTVCQSCATSHGWDSSHPSEVIVLSKDGATPMTAQEFFGE